MIHAADKSIQIRNSPRRQFICVISRACSSNWRRGIPNRAITTLPNVFYFDRPRGPNYHLWDRGVPVSGVFAVFIRLPVDHGGLFVAFCLFGQSKVGPSQMVKLGMERRV